MKVKQGQLVQLRPQVHVDDLTDQGLAAACATGDRAARTLLFERHVDAVHRFVARMRASDADAVDDLVQATFVAAFQSADSFRGQQLRSWLFGIAANMVRGYARKEIRRKRALSVLAAPDAISTREPANLDAARLPAAIAALPHDLRAALVMIDVEGERGKDAAVALRIPEGTLWRRVFHARRALRAALDGGA